jgi:hypothetical protein
MWEKNPGTRKGVILFPLVFFILKFLLSCTCQAVEKRETQISMVITPENPPAGVAYTVTGILSDVSGAPLGNKRVILETSPDGNLSFPFEQVAVVTTDRTGHFEFLGEIILLPEYSEYHMGATMSS